MTPNEQRMWHDIAETIEPYCVNGAGYINDYFEDENCTGFTMKSSKDILSIGLYGCNSVEEFPIEDDLRLYQLQRQAEGMPDEPKT